MLKHAKWVVLAGVIAVVVGCGPGKGERLADKVNEKMLAKIDKGEVKTELDLAFAQLDVIGEAMKDLGIKPDDSISKSDQNKMEEKLKKYNEDWKKRLKEKGKA